MVLVRAAGHLYKRGNAQQGGLRGDPLVIMNQSEPSIPGLTSLERPRSSQVERRVAAAGWYPAEGASHSAEHCMLRVGFEDLGTSSGPGNQDRDWVPEGDVPTSCFQYGIGGV